ncbi:MAG: type II toxin-antitoxin system Phd/YefM family antitoxin [Actinomycetota bacterium]
MTTIGLRELRQKASEILRGVEAGQTATVTVSGRPVAQIVPIRAPRWVPWERIDAIYDSPTDAAWDTERRDFEAPGLRDPWDR